MLVAVRFYDYQIWRAATKNPTYNNYTIRTDAYPEFLEEFLRNYNHIKTNYMGGNVEYLDRYKVAAIIVFSMININVINASESDVGWIANTNKFALSTGLSYLQNEYNQECLRPGQQSICRYSFPQVKEGVTPYLDTLIRTLSHIDTKEASNVLPWASLLLTLESYTLACID